MHNKHRVGQHDMSADDTVLNPENVKQSALLWLIPFQGIILNECWDEFGS